MDRTQHQRYLDYRELFVYFGKKKSPMLTSAQFVEADTAYLALTAKGDARDDEEEAQLAELTKLLFRD